jgi:hypothetical protein
MPISISDFRQEKRSFDQSLCSFIGPEGFSNRATWQGPGSESLWISRTNTNGAGRCRPLQQLNAVLIGMALLWRIEIHDEETNSGYPLRRAAEAPHNQPALRLSLSKQSGRVTAAICSNDQRRRGKLIVP